MDQLNWVLFGNPVSSMVTNTVKSLGSVIFKSEPTQNIVKIPPELEKLDVSKIVLTGNPFVRLAGMSGAAAIILGAYGEHGAIGKTGNEKQKEIYQTANNFHFFNSLALLGVPLSRYPIVTGSLLVFGMVFFSGLCYYDAFTGKTEFRKFVPVGGMLLAFGWLSFLF